MTPLLSSAARRLMGRDIRRPLPPTTARDSYPSMVFSLWDQAPPPSRRLIDVSLAAVRCVIEEQVDLSDIAARPHVPGWLTVWPGEHYRLLAALVRVLRPRRIIEIGTFTGLSALAMRKYLPPDGTLVTFDLLPWDSFPHPVLTAEDFADGRLTQHIADLGQPQLLYWQRQLLESADFIFVDGPKDNRFEYRLVQHLQAMRLKQQPILLFDDTRLWSMLRFWRTLPFPKLDLTSFGSWSGTGLAEIPG